MTPVQEGGTDATPDKVSEGGGEQHDEAPAVTPPALRPKARGLHGYRPRQPPGPTAAHVLAAAVWPRKPRKPSPLNPSSNAPQKGRATICAYLSSPLTGS